MKKGRGRENVYSHEIFSSREVWKKYRLDVCGKIRQPGASRATKANPPTNFQVPSSAKPEWRINEETTGCRFISLVTVFPVSLLRLPCTTTTMATCKRYTRANLPSVWKEREKKQRSCRQLSPNGKEALRGSFCYLVVWFYGSSPSSCDANSIQREQPIRRLAIEPQAIFLRPFQLLLYLLFRLTPGNRAIIISAHQDRKIIVQLYFFFTSLLPSFYF